MTIAARRGSLLRILVIRQFLPSGREIFRSIVANGPCGQIVRDIPTHTINQGPGMTRQQRDNVEILKMLAGRWPRAFAVLEADRRLLKLGIRDYIAALLGTDAPPRLRQDARKYCNAVGYLRQCLPGSTRRDLGASPPARLRAPKPRMPGTNSINAPPSASTPPSPRPPSQMAELATRPAPKASSTSPRLN